MVYIIGKGRVGTGLSLLDESIQMFGREDSLEALNDVTNSDLILVCTRNDDLDPILSSLSRKAQKRIVLVQNGMLSPYISGLAESPAARAILYFAVSKKGDKPQPGGDTLISGQYASQLKEFFDSVSIPSRVVESSEMAKVEMEKLLWNSVMGLFGQVYEESVGDTLEKHWSEVETVIDELLPVIKKDLNIEYDRDELLKSLKDYSHEVDYYSARVKEWEWRNAWFFDALKRQSMDAPKWIELHERVGIK